MAILRGLAASGISRAKSTCSMPSATVAPNNPDTDGEAEVPLERAARDTAMQITAFVFVLFRLTGHDQRILLNGDVQFIRREPGYAIVSWYMSSPVFSILYGG